MPSGVYYWRRVVRSVAAGVPISSASSAPPIRETPIGPMTGMGVDVVPGVPLLITGQQIVIDPTDPAALPLVGALYTLADATPQAYPLATSFSVHTDWAVVIHYMDGSQRTYRATVGTTQHSAPRGAVDEVLSGVEDVVLRGLDSSFLDSLRRAIANAHQANNVSHVVIKLVAVRWGWLLPPGAYTPGLVKNPTLGGAGKPKPKKKSKPKPKSKPKSKPKPKPKGKAKLKSSKTF